MCVCVCYSLFEAAHSRELVSTSSSDSESSSRSESDSESTIEEPPQHPVINSLKTEVKLPLHLHAFSILFLIPHFYFKSQCLCLFLA